MSRRAKLLVLVILPVLAVGSLYLRVLIKRIFFENNQRGGAPAARTRLTQAALQSTSGANQWVILYFPSYAEGKLRAESRSLALAANDPDRIRQILLALIEGPHQGQGRSLPPSTEVPAIFLTADGTAYLDFSKAVLSDFAPGIESETLTVYSVVDSLAASIPAVKRVKILVEGQEVDTLDGHADLTGYFAPDPARISTATP